MLVSIPLSKEPILELMEKTLEKRRIRYDKEALAHYVQMRLSTARKSYCGGPKPGNPNTITLKTIKENWLGAFLDKYNHLL